MKVNGNDRTTESSAEFGYFYSNIPIRLEIASRVMVNTFDKSLYDRSNAKIALKLADMLIEEHNKSCEEKE